MAPGAKVSRGGLRAREAVQGGFLKGAGVGQGREGIGSQRGGSLFEHLGGA